LGTYDVIPQPASSEAAVMAIKNCFTERRFMISPNTD
jgi:hypothetical protein